MPTPVTFNGTVYQVPVQGDVRWAPPLTRYLLALGNNALAKSGGSFTLTGDINFGTSFGLLSKYFISTTTLPATAGVLRLAKTDAIEWRNNANTGNNVLSTDAADNLFYNGVLIPTGLSTLTNGKIWIGSASNMPVEKTLTGDVTVTNLGVTSIGALKISNSQISNSAAIAYTKLNLTGSIVNTDIFSAAAIAYSKLALTNSIVNADINSAAAIAYSKLALSGAILNSDLAGSITYNKLILTGSIVNADIASAAAIAYSKLALSNSIVNADINTAAAISYSKLALTNSIVNADIAAAAAIAYSKLALTNSIVNADINSAAAIAYSKLLLTNSIVNADIAAAAAIAYSKLVLTNSIVNADINTAAAIAYSKLNLTASIVNADIAAAAAIAYSKLAALTINRILVSDASGFVSASTVTTTTLGFLDATSSIQTQLNGKQATGNYITALTGDATATGPGSVPITLATVNSNVGSFNWANITVNAKGLVTAASANATPVTSITGTTNQVIASASTGAVTLSLPQSIGTGSSPTFAGLTLSSPLTVANGGTGDSSLTAYAVLAGGTTSTGPIQSVASLGTSGQVLTSNGAGALPTFQSVSGSGTVNSGTAPLLAFYATTGTAVSAVSANASMGGFKLTNLANGTAASDAATVGQLKILQVVTGTTSTSFTTPSSSFQSTSLTASITPQSASSKIFVIASGSLSIDTGSASTQAEATILRGATSILGVPCQF